MIKTSFIHALSLLACIAGLSLAPHAGAASAPQAGTAHSEPTHADCLNKPKAPRHSSNCHG